jgi:hypothetical protein
LNKKRALSLLLFPPIPQATLVFIDRPKNETFKRIASGVSLPQLDSAFAISAVRTYMDQLAAYPDLSGVSPADISTYDPTNLLDRILLDERDQLMTDALRRARAASPDKPVFALVGEIHLAGIDRCWDRPLEDLKVPAAAAPTAAAAAPATPPKRRAGAFSDQGSSAAESKAKGSGEDENSPKQRALKRLLLERVLQLYCNVDFSEDIAAELGPLETLGEEGMRCYFEAAEVYGSTRMLMAALPKETLNKVFMGYQRDAYELLEPFRQVRPSNGGPGYTEDLLMSVRTLDFYLHADAEVEEMKKKQQEGSV